MAPLGTPRKASAEQRDRPFGLFAANRHLISVLFISYFFFASMDDNIEKNI